MYHVLDTITALKETGAEGEQRGKRSEVVRTDLQKFEANQKHQKQERRSMNVYLVWKITEKGRSLMMQVLSNECAAEEVRSELAKGGTVTAWVTTHHLTTVEEFFESRSEARREAVAKEITAKMITSLGKINV